MVQAADAPHNTPVWDLGFLIGAYIEGGLKTKRKITISGGIGMIWGTDHISTGIYSYTNGKITTVGFPLEAKIFWVYEN